MMGQETYLFDGTIRENLLMPATGAMRIGLVMLAIWTIPRLPAERSLPPPLSRFVGMPLIPRPFPPGRPLLSADDVLRAALAKASALELVDSLPQGLDTPVGELGGRLSEGERQRIGLARVFLRNASLVLFDEPTSRLDAYNESVILQSIDALAQQGSAVLLVSHRDSTMRIADRIVRM